MTPAIKLLEQRKIPHTVHPYTHQRDAQSYGTEAVEKLGVTPDRVFKTLIAAVDTGRSRAALTTAIVPVTGQLNLKALAKACQAKRAEMAAPALVERATGYVLGGVSPLGQKKSLATVLDQSCQPFQTIFVSAGKRGLEIELSPRLLAELLNAQFANIAL